MKKQLPKNLEMIVEIDWVPQTWFGRLIAAVTGVLILWLGFMFFTVFLVIIGLVFAVAIPLLVLALIKTAKGQSSSFIETEYHVEDNNKTEYQNTKYK